MKSVVEFKGVSSNGGERTVTLTFSNEGTLSDRKYSIEIISKEGGQDASICIVNLTAENFHKVMVAMGSVLPMIDEHTMVDLEGIKFASNDTNESKH